MTEASALVATLRRDRAIVVAGLVSVVLAAWLYLLLGAGMDMRAMGEMAQPTAAADWAPGHWAAVFAMWAVMMAAMMLPSAAPTILLYATIARRRNERDGAPGMAGLFVLGYIAVWAAFSLGATGLQRALEATAQLTSGTMTASIAVAGAVLVAAGIYQWTPLKQACLRRCRSPLDFVLYHWRDGPRGAFAMGLRHGAFCLGCCWVLMLLLFVGGVMNLLWIGGLALFVLVEKLAPGGHWLGHAAGVMLVAWGAATLLFLT